MTCGPVCFALLPGIPAGLVALTVGIVGWRITSRQAAIAQAKLKLDLFEKRYPIFQQAWEIMSEVSTKGTRVRPYGLSHPFANFMPQARFLFGKEVEAYLWDAVDKWTELHGYEGERGDSRSAADHAARVAELSGWFHKQASTGLRELFDPYLDFEKWK